MLIFPAVDLLGGEAVRLFKGDYNQKTVYSTQPVNVALDFAKAGCKCMHIVDLEGAKTGETPAFEIIKRIKSESGLFCEVGGGVRSLSVIEKYVNAGIDRVIIGTAAVKNPGFAKEASREFPGKVAASIDVKNGFVAISGWIQETDIPLTDFCKRMQDDGIGTIICTDISKDGAMRGTNREMYRQLNTGFEMNMIASGGVSSIDDIIALNQLGMYGAIIGKAYYTGAIKLTEALEAAK